MTSRSPRPLPDLYADPFLEHAPAPFRRDWQLLGARFVCASNSRLLLASADAAFADLPRHRLGPSVPRVQLDLMLSAGAGLARRTDAPRLAMSSGAGFLTAATGSCSYTVLAPRERAGMVCVTPQMLRFPYHLRYELIEFAVYTLAARVQRLVPLHAACLGSGGRGVLLMGPSGSGKSTVTLQGLLEGLDFISEDSTFVAPGSMRATGLANFLHVRADSLRWIERSSPLRQIRSSPVIRRRSGVKKFEVDLRRGDWALAPSPLRLVGAVFLSSQGAARGPLLRRLSRQDLLARLKEAQAYAASLPEWGAFARGIVRLGGFELRRGRHPQDSVVALRGLLQSTSESNSSTA